MNHRCISFLLVVLAMFAVLPAQAQRAACKASYDKTSGALNLDAVDVGSTRYIVKMSAVSGGNSVRFKLDSATPTASRECFDAASISGSTLTIPDLAVSGSFFAATLSLVSGDATTQINLVTASPSSLHFDIAAASKNPRLEPDAGLRVEKASNPFASVNSNTGLTYLGYQDRSGGPESFKQASDGLTFSNPTAISYSNRSVDSRRTLMPDGKTWRLYQMSPTGVMSSYVSSDGNTFTAESGTRYTAPASDNGSTGVYDVYLAADRAVVLVYVGDLRGKNNLRMAKSTDNGVTFSYVKGNVLGDDDAGGGGNSFIDNKTILLADGRRRMFTMRAAELQSFVTSDGYTWSREAGTRISYKDFASVGVTIYSLNDPVPVIDKDGKLKIYVAASTAAMADEGAGNTNWAIVSATWNESSGSGALPSTASFISQSTCLFNWAEQTYPQFFAPAGAVAAQYEQYYYRYYPGTGNYLATAADNYIYLLGPISGNAILKFAPMAGYLAAVSCPQ